MLGIAAVVGDGTALQQSQEVIYSLNCIGKVCHTDHCLSINRTRNDRSDGIMNDDGMGNGGGVAALIRHGISSDYLIFATLGIVRSLNCHVEVGENGATILDTGISANEGGIQRSQIGIRGGHIVGTSHGVVHQYAVDGGSQRIHNTEGILAGGLALIAVSNHDIDRIYRVAGSSIHRYCGRQAVGRINRCACPSHHKRLGAADNTGSNFLCTLVGTEQQVNSQRVDSDTRVGGRAFHLNGGGGLTVGIVHRIRLNHYGIEAC